MKLKHIGIVGVTAEGAALCYRTIVAESDKRLGPNQNPPISLHNPPFAPILAAQKRRDWQKVAQILLKAIGKLAAAGADFVIIPANSVHFVIEEIQKRSPIPVLNLVKIAADACRSQKYRKVLVLGVGITIHDKLYEKPLVQRSITCVAPTEEEQKEIDRIIYNELVQGVTKQQSTNTMLRLIVRYQRRGCDAVVLACTELPLVITQDNAPLPIIDTTKLLAQHSVTYASKGASRGIFWPEARTRRP